MEQERGDLHSKQMLLEEDLEASRLQVGKRVWVGGGGGDAYWCVVTSLQMLLGGGPGGQQLQVGLWWGRPVY